jgi:hypothetical protein
MLMDDGLDELLTQELLEPPRDFVPQVMQRIGARSPARALRMAPAWLSWAAIACGVALGIDELISFMLSAWLTATAF